jgi:hypothetical protein
VLLGHVDVDSGQILVCDPCYLGHSWKRGEKFKDYRPCLVTWKGKVTKIDMGKMIEEGINYATPLPQFGNLTMNQLAAKKLAVAVPIPPTGEFSYDGCCKATQSPNLGGPLNHTTGHAGAGVVVQSGYGDGTYPVYAFYNEEGRIVRVEVCFD